MTSGSEFFIDFVVSVHRGDFCTLSWSFYPLLCCVSTAFSRCHIYGELSTNIYRRFFDVVRVVKNRRSFTAAESSERHCSMWDAYELSGIFDARLAISTTTQTSYNSLPLRYVWRLRSFCNTIISVNLKNCRHIQLRHFSIYLMPIITVLQQGFAAF